MKKITLLLFCFSIRFCIAQPVINFSPSDSGCVGQTFSISAFIIAPGDSVLNYAWDFGDGTPVVNTQQPSVMHQFNTPGFFNITLIVDFQNYGPDTAIAQSLIKTGTTPVAAIDAQYDTICFQQSIQFNNLSTGTGWFWQFGDGGFSYDQFPIHQYNIDTSGASDLFDIILVAYNNGCANADTVVNMIAVLGPIPYFISEVDCDSRDSVTFTNLTSGVNQYTWDFGDGSPNSNSTDVSHVYPFFSSFTVTLTSSSLLSGCTVDTIHQISLQDHVFATISESGGTLYSSISDPQHNYGWFVDGQLISNYPGPFCTPTQSGNYVVVVYDPFSGCTDTSVTYSFTLDVEDLLRENEIIIYPNPFHGKLQIKVTNEKTLPCRITLRNTLGQTFISQYKMDSLFSELDLENIPVGIYSISFESSVGRRTFRIIKS